MTLQEKLGQILLILKPEDPQYQRIMELYRSLWPKEEGK